MENKDTKYSLLFNVVKHYEALNLGDNNVRFESKWLSNFLLGMALILWIIFNIVAIENNQLSPYLLVFLNIMLYCIIAVMASPDHYSESKLNPKT
jgi:uncharacterized membrane protein